MKVTKNKFLCISTKIIYLILLCAYATNICYAASQGKLSIQSSASIEISVHVNQSLTAIGPEELLLNQNKSPLCVMHNGYKKDASVPYELKVDEIKVVDGVNFPLNIFLEDKHSLNSKQLLMSGSSFLRQSNLSTSNQHEHDCRSSGLQLSLEAATHYKNTFDNSFNTAGSLILLVSPN